MITQLDFLNEVGRAPLQSMPMVYYVIWPEEKTRWKFDSEEKALAFRRDHKGGWDMTISPTEEEDEPTDIGSGTDTRDE